MICLFFRFFWIVRNEKKCMLFWKLAKSLTQPRLTRVLWPTFSNPRLSSLWTLSGLCVPALADSPYIYIPAAGVAVSWWAKASRGETAEQGTAGKLSQPSHEIHTGGEGVRKNNLSQEMWECSWNGSNSWFGFADGPGSVRSANAEHFCTFTSPSNKNRFLHCRPTSCQWPCSCK